MNKSFRHILLTRFNVRKKNNKPLSDIWIRNRLEIFKRICVPSVNNQTIKNFTWLILIDEESPEFLITTLQKIGCDFVRIPYWDVNIIREIIKPLICNESHLITTRLDNDDAITIDFIENIQNFFNYQDLILLNFNKGIVWDSVHKRIYVRNAYTNPWVSMIERIEDGCIKTVFIREHQELFKYYKLKCIGDKPMWLMNVHDNNYANNIKKYYIPADIKYLEHFGIPSDEFVGIAHEPFLTFDNLFRYMYYFAFISSRPLIKYLIKMISKNTTP